MTPKNNLIEVSGQDSLKMVFMQNNIRSGQELADAIFENSDIAEEIFGLATMIESFDPEYMKQVEAEFAQMTPRTPPEEEDGF